MAQGASQQFVFCEELPVNIEAAIASLDNATDKVTGISTQLTGLVN
jgi:hypothetical protein